LGVDDSIEPDHEEGGKTCPNGQKTVDQHETIIPYNERTRTCNS
jgi:hypothetical protein